MLIRVDIDLLGYVKRELLARPRADWPVIAAAANVGESTIQKIAYGVTANPGSSTVQSLANVLLSGGGRASDAPEELHVS